MVKTRKYVLITIMLFMVLTLGVGVSKWNIHYKVSFDKPTIEFAENQLQKEEDINNVNVIDGTKTDAHTALIVEDVNVSGNITDSDQSAKTSISALEIKNSIITYDGNGIGITVDAQGVISSWDEWGIEFVMEYFKYDETDGTWNKLTETPTDAGSFSSLSSGTATIPTDAGSYRAKIQAKIKAVSTGQNDTTALAKTNVYDEDGNYLNDLANDQNDTTALALEKINVYDEDGNPVDANGTYCAFIDFEIEPKPVELTWKMPTDLVYDGTAKNPTATYVDVNNTLKDATITITQSGNKIESAKNAGTYKATATISDTNYAISGESVKPFTIEQRVAQIEWTAPKDLVYDGKKKTPTATVTNLVNDKETCDVFTALASGNGTNVGAFTYKATDLSNANYKLPDNENDVTSPEYTITPRTVTLTWKAPEYLVYDGTAKIPTVVVGNLVSGDIDKVTAQIALTDGEDGVVNVNVGTFRYKATDLLNEATGLSNKNYKLPDNVTSPEYTITAKSVTLTWLNTTFTYDGNPHAPTAEINSGDVVSGDVCEVTVDGAQTNAGTYTAKAKISNTNYAISGESVTTFIINKAEVTLTWSVGTYIYNGQEQKPTAQITSGLVSGDTCTVTVEGAKNAGTHTAKASLDGADKDNYTITNDTQNQEFTINKAQLTIKANDVTVSAGKTPDYTVTYTGFVKDEDEEVLTGTLAFDCDYSANEQNPQETYTITITPDCLTSNNYDITYETGTLTVTGDKIITSPTFSADFTYDGKAHDLITNFTDILQDIDGLTGLTITVNDQSVTDLTTSPTATNAGNYAIAITLPAGCKWSDNTNSTVTRTVTVATRTLNITISATTTTIVYGQTIDALGLTITPTGLQGTDTLENNYNLKFGNTSVPPTDTTTLLNAGSYTLGIELTNDTMKNNYTVQVQPFGITVDKLKVALNGLIEKDYGNPDVVDGTALKNYLVLVNAETTTVDYKSVITIGTITAKNYLTDDVADDNKGLIKYSGTSFTITIGSTYLVTATATSSNKNIEFVANDTDRNLYIKYKTAKVGDIYYTIEDALTQSGEIILASNSSKNNTYVITAFSKLGYYNTDNTDHEYTAKNIIKLPHSADTTGTPGTTWKTTGASNVGSVLIIPTGVTLNTTNNIEIYAVIGNQGSVTTRAVIMNHGTINIDGTTNGATIYAHGYLKGSGVINLTKATVEDIFKTFDFKGGDNTFGIYNETKDYFPINAYSLHNVSCKTIINSGSTYAARFHLTMGGDWFGHEADPVYIIGNSSTNALFKLSSGYIKKSGANAPGNTELDTITGSNQLAGQKEVIKICGEAADGKVTIEIKIKGVLPVKMETGTNNPLPVPYMEIHIGDGTNHGNLTLSASSYKFMPGSSVIVHEGSTLTTGGSTQLVFYTVDQATQAETVIQYKNAAGVVATYPYIYMTNYCKDKVDSYLEVNGKATINGSISGTIKSSVEGAQFIANKISTDITVLNTLYAGVNDLLGLFTYAAVTTRKTSNFLPMTAQGNIMTSATTYANRDLSTGTYYSKFVNDKYVWYSEQANITYISNGGTEVATVTRDVGTNGYQIVASDLPTITRIHYNFAGWYIDKEFTTQALGQVIFASATLYAKWTPVEYTITYVPVFTDGAAQGTNTFVNHKDNKATCNIESTFMLGAPTCGDLSFFRWFSDEACTQPISQIAYLDTNITIYAQFYPAGTQFFTINYVTNNESVNDPGIENILGGETYNAINYDDKNNNKQYPYYFIGWYQDAELTTPFNNGTTINSDITLYGKWVKKARFILSYSSESFDQNVYLYTNQSITLPDIADYSGFTVPTGYKFVGFNVDSTTNCTVAPVTYSYEKTDGFISGIKTNIKVTGITEKQITATGTSNDVVINISPIIKKIVKITFDLNEAIATLTHTRPGIFSDDVASGSGYFKINTISKVVDNTLYSTNGIDWGILDTFEPSGDIYVLSGDEVNVQINNVYLEVTAGSWLASSTGKYTFSIGDPPSGTAKMPEITPSIIKCDSDSVKTEGDTSGVGKKDGYTVYTLTINKDATEDAATIEWKFELKAETSGR